MYCHVTNNTPGQPQSLPQNWQNTSNFNLLPDTELAKFGWYPVQITVPPQYNPLTQKADRTLQFTGSAVVEVWTVVSLTADEQMQLLLQHRDRLEKVVEQHLDLQVSGRDYKTLDRCTTWISSTDPAWAEDARLASVFRDQCWKILYQIQDDVVAGIRPLPSDSELLAALPTLWPPPAPPAPTPPPDNGNGTI